MSDQKMQLFFKSKSRAMTILRANSDSGVVLVVTAALTGVSWDQAITLSTVIEAPMTAGAGDSIGVNNGILIHHTLLGVLVNDKTKVALKIFTGTGAVLDGHGSVIGHATVAVGVCDAALIHLLAPQ
ncbi:hypothetical protein E2C01_005609 [Portunus trituberculatus]|uniref:Uncharacterized protein n=1 Tax=Portunus trituberculatus TaxID=210409 RepID=A0A5B7CVY7_PORTR|nr:hypothetical protein [Portunus trituberculatus]